MAEEIQEAVQMIGKFGATSLHHCRQQAARTRTSKYFWLYRAIAVVIAMTPTAYRCGVPIGTRAV